MVDSELFDIVRSQFVNASNVNLLVLRFFDERINRALLSCNGRWGWFLSKSVRNPRRNSGESQEALTVSIASGSGSGPRSRSISISMEVSMALEVGSTPLEG